MPIAGPRLPPPSHVTNVNRAMSSSFDDCLHHPAHARFRVVAPMPHVAAQELPCVHVARDDQAIEHLLTPPPRGFFEIPRKLSPHGLAMSRTAACQPTSHVDERVFFCQHADHE